MYTVHTRRDAIMGNRIKEVRKAKGMTQKELAEKLGVTPQAVSQFENSDGSKFNYSTLTNIAEALECSVDDLLEFDEVMSQVIKNVSHLDPPRNYRLGSYLMAEASKLNRMGHDALSSYLELLLNTEKYTSEDPDVLKAVWGEEVYEKFYPKDSSQDFEVETGIYHLLFDADKES